MTFGSLQCDEAASFAIIGIAAAERGVDFIDTADKYPVAGAARGGRPHRGDRRPLAARQARPVVAHDEVRQPDGARPCATTGSSRKHVIEACEASLRRLQTDRIDLYQLHVRGSVDAAR